jgi:hypothetical protein
MSDFSADPHTLVKMQTLRRFAHYNRGEVIAVTLDQAHDLANKRLAQPLAIMVPIKPAEPGAPVDSTPTRQPSQVVRK